MEENKAAASPETKHNSRNSAVECLKIFGIILIILSHVVQTLSSENPYVGYQDYVLTLGNATTDSGILLLNLLRYAGAFGNTIFFICSAWYLLDSKKANGKKIVSMLLEIWVLSVVIMLMFKVFYPGNLDIKLMIKSLFPTTFSLNWYLTCYLLFYAIHPFLNRVIYAMNQRTLLRSALLLSMLYIFMNYVKSGLFETSGVILWVAIYFCIAYMKLYLQNISKKKIYNWILIFLGIGGNCIIVILTNFLGLRIGFFNDKLLHWCHNCSPMLIMATIGMFNLVRDSNFKNTMMNKLSGFSLLIYIIHENIFIRTYLRPYMWQRIYEAFGYEHILLWIFIQVVVIFVACLIICVVYRFTLQKVVSWLSNRGFQLFCRIYEKIENVLIKIK